MSFEIIRYSPQWEEKWDRFVLSESVNGTFLQSRNFLNYHPEGRFTDASLLILQGNSIAAVIPACEGEENGKRCFWSHRGSTFGGLILAEEKYNVTALEEIFPLVEDDLKREGYACAFFRSPSEIFARQGTDLLDYYYYKNGYRTIDELSFWIDCTPSEEELLKSWSSGRRRDYRYSLKNSLEFRPLEGDEELAAFYEILKNNLARHGQKPVHSLAELKDFRDCRLKETAEFFGVFHQGGLIAGTMTFSFGKDVFHTQYLAQDSEYSRLFTMNNLIGNLIFLAHRRGFRKFSFGISTEDRGRLLNTGLAVFKEGFGARYCNNRSYYREF